MKLSTIYQSNVKYHCSYSLTKQVEGQTIYAPSHAQGIGKITAILGDRLIAKFPNYLVPVIITNWQEAINRQEILPASSQQITSLW